MDGTLIKRLGLLDQQVNFKSSEIMLVTVDLKLEIFQKTFPKGNMLLVFKRPNIFLPYTTFNLFLSKNGSDPVESLFQDPAETVVLPSGQFFVTDKKTNKLQVTRLFRIRYTFLRIRLQIRIQAFGKKVDPGSRP